MADENFQNDEPVILKSDMSDKIQKIVLECAQRAINEFDREDRSSIAQYIKNEFDEKFGNYWACFVGHKFGSFFSFAEGTVISFYIGDLLFLYIKFFQFLILRFISINRSY